MAARRVYGALATSLLSLPRIGLPSSAPDQDPGLCLASLSSVYPAITS